MEYFEGYAPDKRPWRTMMRVLKIHKKGVAFLIPGWDPNTPVFFPWEKIDEKVAKNLVPGYRLLAFINKGAEKKEDLIVYAWDDSRPQLLKKE